jgi:hypothetical protein
MPTVEEGQLFLKSAHIDGFLRELFSRTSTRRRYALVAAAFLLASRIRDHFDGEPADRGSIEPEIRKVRGATARRHMLDLFACITAPTFDAIQFDRARRGVINDLKRVARPSAVKNFVALTEPSRLRRRPTAEEHRSLVKQWEAEEAQLRRKHNVDKATTGEAARQQPRAATPGRGAEQQ